MGHYKKLARTVVEVAGGPTEPVVWVQPESEGLRTRRADGLKRWQEKNHAPAQEVRQREQIPSSAFCFVQASSDWMVLTHLGGGGICFTRSTNLNAHLIQNTLTETPRIKVSQISELTWSGQGDTKFIITKQLRQSRLTSLPSLEFWTMQMPPSHCAISPVPGTHAVGASQMLEVRQNWLYLHVHFPSLF